MESSEEKWVSLALICCFLAYMSGKGKDVCGFFKRLIIKNLGVLFLKDFWNVLFGLIC